MNDCDGEPILIDDHGSRVGAEAWTLFDEVIRRYGVRPTLIEWDTDIPALSVLLDEAAKADRAIVMASPDAARAA